jgi:tetratricopeptide (TPR) repeat protein
MRGKQESAARAAMAQRPRRASRWTGSRRLYVAVLGVLLSVAAWHAAKVKSDAAERGRLAKAAALDRQSRDDQLRVWSTALASDSQSSMAMAQLAALNVQKARETGQESYYPVAEDFARRSLGLRTQRNAKTLVVLASALLAQHRFSEAREAARAAVALEPETPQYRALLAELDMELGDYEAAGAAFGQLRAYRAHLSIGPRLARWLEVSGDHESARRVLNELVIQAGRRPDLPREQLAWFHFRSGDHSRRYGRPRAARRSFEQALRINPGDYRALKGLAELDLARGRSGPALDRARVAVRASRTPETLLTLAYALRATGGMTEARAIEAEVRGEIGADGGSFERAWHRYRLDFAMEIDDVALILEREVSQRRDVQGYDLLARAHLGAGRPAAAGAAMRQALRTGTNDPETRFHAGMIALAQSDTAAGQSHLGQAVKTNPSFHRVQAPRARAALEALHRGSRGP